MSKRTAACALVILLFATLASAQARFAGMFASSATPVWDLLSRKPESAKSVRIHSPNRSSLVVATLLNDGSGVQISLRRGGLAFWRETFKPGVGIEIGWAPDSKAFFVTTSNAGLNGGYELATFFVKGQAVQRRDLTSIVQAAFGHPVNCGWEEEPNVAAVKWIDSSRLIVVAEIVHHSNCDSFGTFRAYEVALPKTQIVREYDQIEAKRLFATDLGWELIQAPDKCIKHPKSCWVASNH